MACLEVRRLLFIIFTHNAHYNRAPANAGDGPAVHASSIAGQKMRSPADPFLPSEDDDDEEAARQLFRNEVKAM